MSKPLTDVLVSPQASLKEVLARMARNKPLRTAIPAGIVLVTDKSGRLAGIATDGDLRRALSNGSSLHTAIADVMNTDPFLIEGPSPSGEILARVADKIRENQWHKNRLDKIVIVDAARRPIDIVSFYDLWQQSDVRFKRIGIVGLGYVGLTLGLTLADVGFTVCGVDANNAVAAGLKKGRPHFFETGLEALLSDYLSKKFHVVDSFAGRNNCDIYFITVGTPIGEGHKPSLAYLKEAARSIGAVLKSGDAVVLRSTVPIGTTRNVVIPILEEVSRLRAEEGFLVAFAPERTVEGKALEELRTLPQVIGGLNHASADVVASIFSFMTNSTVLVDSLEGAEMVKLINNTYRDLTFAFANQVALIAQRWGIDTRRVIEAANYGYSRSHVPFPSPGVGGYCLEKDPFIFIDSARVQGIEARLTREARLVNEAILDLVGDQIMAFLKKEKKKKEAAKILVCGIAFKGRPVTSDTRGSTSVALIRRMQRAGYRNIHVYDPAVPAAAIKAYGVRHVPDIQKGFQNADAVIVMTNHPEFETFNMRQLLAATRKPTRLFDGWALYPPDEVTKVQGVQYWRL